jgi:hypothetical protein
MDVGDVPVLTGPPAVFAVGIQLPFEFSPTPVLPYTMCRPKAEECIFGTGKAGHQEGSVPWNLIAGDG